MLIGVIGKPSTGKSTFFKAATLANIEISPRPFTTIKPNRAVGYVKIDCVETFFKTKCNPREGYCINGKRFVPIDLLDVAGLIEGAYEGKGLGNQFLNDLSQGDALIHIVDIAGMTNEKGEIVKPLSHDPLKDVEMIEKEVDLWYFSILEKAWDKFVKKVVNEKKDIRKEVAKQFSGLKITEEMVEKAVKVFHSGDPLKWTKDELKQFCSVLRKLSKPMLIVANKIDVEGAELNYHRLKEKYKEYNVVPCSADSELALREASKSGLIEYIPGDKDFKIINESKLSENQKKALESIKENVLKKFGSTGIQQALDFAVFELLKCIAVFPGGVNNLKDSEGRVIPDCFILKENSTALDFAFRIHTDIGNKFVKAIDVKKKLPVSKDYKLKNLDVIEIKTS